MQLGSPSFLFVVLLLALAIWLKTESAWVKWVLQSPHSHVLHSLLCPGTAWLSRGIHGWEDACIFSQRPQSSCIDYTSSPCCISVFVLVHEQQYHAEAHLFQPCQSGQSGLRGSNRQQTAISERTVMNLFAPAMRVAPLAIQTQRRGAEKWVVWWK